MVLPMKLLALETSTERASIALSFDQKLWVEETFDIKRHAEWVLPGVERLLHLAHLNLTELDGIVFGQGPGSFTGLRVACALAQGLALGLDCPVYPVGGLVSIAHQIKAPKALVVLDARMHEWYWAVFEGNRQVSETQVSAPSTVEVAGGDPFILAGVGFEPLLQELPEPILKRLQQTQICYPHASSMIQAVQQGQIQAVSAQEARPNYIRHKVT